MACLWPAAACLSRPQPASAGRNRPQPGHSLPRPTGQPAAATAGPAVGRSPLGLAQRQRLNIPPPPALAQPSTVARSLFPSVQHAHRPRRPSPAAQQPTAACPAPRARALTLNGPWPIGQPQQQRRSAHAGPHHAPALSRCQAGPTCQREQLRLPHSTSAGASPPPSIHPWRAIQGSPPPIKG